MRNYPKFYETNVTPKLSYLNVTSDQKQEKLKDKKMFFLRHTDF